MKSDGHEYVRGYLDIEARYNPKGPFAPKTPDEKPDQRMFRDWVNWHPWVVALVKVKNIYYDEPEYVTLDNGTRRPVGSKLPTEIQQNIQFLCSPHCIPEAHYDELNRSSAQYKTVPQRHFYQLSLRNLVEQLYGGSLGPINELWTYNGRMRSTEWDEQNPYIVRGTNGKPTGETVVRVGFDLGIIYHTLGLDLELTRPFKTYDLCVLCWSLGHYGGLKKLETKFGFKRPPNATMTETGEDCVKLWDKYLNHPDENFPTLQKLLDYNVVDCNGTAHIEKGIRLQEIG